MDIRICILHRGWVLVGEYDRDGEWITLRHAFVIRQWGTTRGIGELAREGPKPETILDREPESEFHQSQMIRAIKCDSSKWREQYEGLESDRAGYEMLQHKF